MYRYDDIEKIKLNLDNIVEESIKIYKTNYEPIEFLEYSDE